MNRITIGLLLVFTTSNLVAQEKVAQKPQYVIIINNEIVSNEKVDEYAQQGYVKAMNKGVSDEEREKLYKKFGDKIGDKEFIVIISLYTEKEKKENEKKSSAIANNVSKVDNDYILKVNDTAKEFTVDMINGKDIKLSELKGKVILINFWATWCAPCLMEFYDIPSKIIEPFKNSEFVFLAISRGEDEDKVLKKMLKLKKDGIDFNVGIDPDETIWNQYAKEAIPKSKLGPPTTSIEEKY